MAYTAVVQVLPLDPSPLGRPAWIIIADETDCALGDKWDTGSKGAVLPEAFRVVSRKVNLVSGGATTLAPVQSRVADVVTPGPDSIAVENAVAVADGLNSAAHFVAYVPSRVVYARSQPNTGATNVIHTEIVLVDGVEP